jgi:hypothetical protein
VAPQADPLLEGAQRLRAVRSSTATTTIRGRSDEAKLDLAGLDMQPGDHHDGLSATDAGRRRRSVLVRVRAMPVPGSDPAASVTTVVGDRHCTGWWRAIQTSWRSR